MTILERYSPKHLSQVLGNSSQKERVLSFVKNHGKQKKRALLLWGDVRTGKTLLAHLVAKELDMPLVEITASDKRSKKSVNELLFPALTSASIFGGKKLILIDDIDCMSAQDRGGVTEVAKLISQSPHPVILTAQDYWNRKLTPLRKQVSHLELEPIPLLELVAYLDMICKHEGVLAAKDALVYLAKERTHDVRAALIDLDVLLQEKRPLTIERAKLINPRDEKTNLQNTLTLMMRAKSFEDAHHALFNSQESYDTVMPWIDENIAHAAKTRRETLNAHDYLSRADVFRGRILKRQYWRLLAYVTTFMAAASYDLHPKKIEYPRKFRKLFQFKNQTAKARALARKLAPILHASPKTVQQHYFPLLKKIVEANKHGVSSYGLDNEDAAFLLKYY
ncbi:hypothetical protein COT72_02640 [archaeon CG10_big_fil_rev_8_21_14_0_10_43_11]|nr:MAG: hypothetical protein COT72_02640 [archaeon CG10_big_fil_rev_8_21_14_0_10_43_11]